LKNVDAINICSLAAVIVMSKFVQGHWHNFGASKMLRVLPVFAWNCCLINPRFVIGQNSSLEKVCLLPFLSMFCIIPKSLANAPEVTS
jgi:hypothetical protein